MKKTRFVLEDSLEIPNITYEEKDAFLKGISTRSSILDNSKQSESDDPKAKPNYGINIRLNDYQLNLIRKVCAYEERSQQQIIKRFLLPALEGYIKEKNII